MEYFSIYGNLNWNKITREKEETINWCNAAAPSIPPNLQFDLYLILIYDLLIVNENLLSHFFFIKFFSIEKKFFLSDLICNKSF